MSNDFLRELASSRPVYQEMQGLGMLRTGISEYKLQSKKTSFIKVLILMSEIL